MLPIFASDILQVGPEGLGILRAAPFAGSVITGLLLAHRPPMARRAATCFGQLEDLVSLHPVRLVNEFLFIALSAFSHRRL